MSVACGNTPGVEKLLPHISIGPSLGDVTFGSLSGSRLKGLRRCCVDKSASQSKLVINDLIHTFGTPLALGRVGSIVLLIVICPEERGKPRPWPRMIELGGEQALRMCTAWHQLSVKCWVHLFSYRLQFVSLRSVLRIAQLVTASAVCVLVSSVCACLLVCCLYCIMLMAGLLLQSCLSNCVASNDWCSCIVLRTSHHSTVVLIKFILSYEHGGRANISGGGLLVPISAMHLKLVEWWID
jgi:hypothetical protein